MSRAGDLKARKACMHVGQEERSAGFKSVHSLQKPEATLLMRPVPVTHTVWYSLTTQGPTPPRAHATQLQTGLSKENGLAGTRATKHPVWDGTSGRSSQPTTPCTHSHSPACERSAAARGKGSFPPSALAVSLVHVCPGMSNHHPQLTSGKRVAVEPRTETGQDKTLLWAFRSSSLGLLGSAGDVGRPSEWIVGPRL